MENDTEAVLCGNSDVYDVEVVADIDPNTHQSSTLAKDDTNATFTDHDLSKRAKPVPWYPQQCLVLLRQVLKEDKPFKNQHGSKRDAWDVIAAECLQNCAFKDVYVLTGVHVQRKWKTLLDKHRRDASSAPFRSGSAEETTEATRLLDELLAAVDDIDLEEVYVKEELQKDKKRKEMIGNFVESSAKIGRVETSNRRNKRKVAIKLDGTKTGLASLHALFRN